MNVNIKSKWDKQIKIGSILFCVFLTYIILGDNADCSSCKNFYKNQVRNKVIFIYYDTLLSKGTNIYYYLNEKKDLYFFQNTLSFYKDFESLQIGDSIVKKANETDFDVYRNDTFYKRAELGCICNYCR